MTLTKAAITEIISEKNNLSPTEARETIEALLEIVKSTLVSGESIMELARRNGFRQSLYFCVDLL